MSRRKSMQISVENILKAHGKLEEFEQAEPGEFYLKLEQEGYMPLVIEKTAKDRIAIAHYYTQNGDVMYDPEIVFFYCPQWQDAHFCPVEITQPPMVFAGRVIGGYRSKFIERDGKTYVDTRFDRDVGELVRVWAKNLQWQGWDSATIAGN